MATAARDRSAPGEVRAPRRWTIPGSPRVDLLVLSALAALAFAVQSLAWPLSPGRDAQSYLAYYLELGAGDPVFPQNMLFRPPLAPLFNGLALDLGGAELAEVLMGAIYVGSVLATYLIGSIWSRGAGLAAALVLLAYPDYGAMFHLVSSDALFGFGLVAWTLFACRTATAPTTAKFAVSGLALFVLAMIRPSAVALLPVAVAVPLLAGGNIRRRLLNAAVLGATAVAALTK